MQPFGRWLACALDSIGSRPYILCSLFEIAVAFNGKHHETDWGCRIRTNRRGRTSGPRKSGRSIARVVGLAGELSYETANMTEPSNASDRHTAHDEEHSSTMDLTPPNSTSEPGDSPHATTSVVAYLSIRKQPPTHVFSDEVIEVEFTIEAARGSSDSPPTNVQMQASLQVLEDEEALPPTLLRSLGDGSNVPGGIKETAAASTLRIKILEEPRVSASRRTGKLRCRISSSTSLPRACAIRLFTKDNIVAEVVTRHIYIVSSKLKVLADNWNSIWYKDEGGRDKCMEVQVAVYNANDQLVPDNAHLKLTLCYDEKSNFLAVINQDLLRSLGTKPVHQLDGGRCRLRFRIEDVSKNHQGQDFCVKVESSNPLVAPGYTPSVSVRSKRNKRQRTSISSSGSVDTGSVPTQRQAPSALQSSYGQFSSYGASSLVEGSTSAPAGSSLDPQTLRGAIQGVVQWAEEVVNGLYPLQWQVLGYAQHVDGSPDYSRPYHSMPNPNLQISRILSLYSEETRNHLRLLEDAASRAVFGTSVASESGAGGSGATQQSSGLAMGTARESPYPAHDPYAAASLHLQGPHPVPPQSQLVNRTLPLGSSAMAGSPAMHPPQPQLPMPPPRGSALVAEGNYREYPFSDYYGRHVPQAPPPVPYPYHYPRYDESVDSLTLRASSKTTQHHHRSPAAVDARMAEDEEIDDDQDDDDTHESNVEYVLAKQYKSLRTGQHLGFPAFSARKKILGFYRETPPPPSGLDASGSAAAGSSRPALQDHHHHHFVALRRDSVDYDEIVQQAEMVLQKAFDSNSEALHALKDWGSIRSMVDHALVYDWSKDMGGSSSGTGSAAPGRHRHHSSR